MKHLKIKAPNTILHDKQLKRYDFIEDFVEIESKTFLKIDICEKTIQPYLKNIKKNCEDSKIERTSSRLENMFLKIMSKHIKRKMKTFKGAETRAKLTLAFWDLKNMKNYIH